MTVVARNFDIIETNCDNPTFLGMKVNKKISKKACVRNKIKRRMRHLLRLLLSDNDLNLSKTALIFIPYKNFELVEFTKLLSELKSILKRADALIAKYGTKYSKNLDKTNKL